MTAQGLSLNDLSMADAGTLADSILSSATGTILQSSISLSDLQDAMVGVVKRLSSYDLQFIQTTNELETKKVDWPSIRGGDIASVIRSCSVVDPTLDKVDVARVQRHHIGDYDPLTMLDVAFVQRMEGTGTLEDKLAYSVVSRSSGVGTGSSAPLSILKIEES